MNKAEIRNMLNEKGQEQLLRFENELSDSDRKDLYAQISGLDCDFERILSKHKAGDVKRGKIEPLGALEVDEIEARRAEFEAAGIEALKAEKVGAVLLAGGQGTRLGLDKPKGMLNVGVHKDLYLFECLINNILDVVKITGHYIPLYIMTSVKNNDETVLFFEEHNYFGYNPEYVGFFVQEMAPSVDYNGKVYLEEKGKISLSPNGNGGWFTSLAKAGYLAEMKDRNVEWLNVFSVDNVLQRINDPCFVGATILSGCDTGAKVVRKAAPDERVGVLCLEDGKPSIVEYYEMTDEMIHSKKENGDLSYNFGVTLNYLFKISKLEEIMNNDMPAHVVEKKIPYVDDNGNTVKPETPNGYKFEQLVLDMIHMMDDCLSYEVVRNKEFAPIKNKEGVDSLETAQALMKENGIDF